ncbi:MAG: Asp-tRNA(Asn)/Glu-tRNA(Gln) amidotransferase subunit GatB [Candidatus Omnitrophica bacterium]|nr:Asp-tRNA(Asn)/Glu-tRNA(Gln) amidotransferase subunit GatB [Candidatus Omnitrophota bacterium]
MEEHEIVIGLEVHAELLTESKMFCGCSTKFGSAPNTQICPVCAGLPGTLPVINGKAVELALKAAIALKCRPASFSRFARKHYFYPDLPKNFQISQFEEPLAEGGYLSIEGRTIRIKRIHMEEDAGKLLHSEDEGSFSSVDLNRSCVPLIEIVTEPDIRSSFEAEKFLASIKRILEYLEVSDCNMEEGSLRCDANISVRKKGDEAFGVKTEIKNMNSFKAVRKALDYEARRQISQLKKGEKLRQETRLWNDGLQITEGMRSKEEAHDYRYFPEPDLVPFTVDSSWTERITAMVGELPVQRKERFIKDYSLSDYDAEVLTAGKDTADYFEKCAAGYPNPKLLANWIMGDIAALLKSHKTDICDSPVGPESLVRIASMIEEGKITGSIVKKALQESFDTGIAPEKIIAEKNLAQIHNEDRINAVIKETVEENPKAVQDYKNGKEQAVSFLIGQIMRKTSGQANPAILKKNLLEYLKEIK